MSHHVHHLRFARPVSDLGRSVAMYQRGLGLRINPYWDAHGRTFEDHDGYRVVLQQAAWRDEEQPGAWR